MLFVGEILGAALIREQNGNIVVGKTGSLELVDDVDRMGLSFCDADDRGF